MIKDNQQHFNRLHVIIDAFVIVVSYILAWWLKFSSGILDSPGGALSFGFYMKALVVIVPLYLILYYAFTDGSGQFTWDNFIGFFVLCV